MHYYYKKNYIYYLNLIFNYPNSINSIFINTQNAFTHTYKYTLNLLHSMLLIYEKNNYKNADFKKNIPSIQPYPLLGDN